MIKVNREAECADCNRVFNLLDEDDANEWYYGHDCEPVDDKFERVFGGGY